MLASDLLKPHDEKPQRGQESEEENFLGSWRK